MEMPTSLIPIMLAAWMYLYAEERGSIAPLRWALGALIFSSIVYFYI